MFKLYRDFIKWLWYEKEQEIINRIIEKDKVSTRTLVILRIISFVIVMEGVIWWFVHFSRKEGFFKQFSYLTVWGGIFTLITFGLLIYEHYYEYKYKGERASKSWHLTHIFFVTWTTIETPISLLFWFAIYPTGDYNTFSDLVVITQVHALFLLLLLIDFYVNRIEWRKRLSSLIIFMGFIYGIFLFFITKFNGIVYEEVTFLNIYSLIMAVFCVLFTAGVFYLYLFLTTYKFKSRGLILKLIDDLPQTEVLDTEEINEAKITL